MYPAVSRGIITEQNEPIPENPRRIIMKIQSANTIPLTYLGISNAISADSATVFVCIALPTVKEQMMQKTANKAAANLLLMKYIAPPHSLPLIKVLLRTATTVSAYFIIIANSALTHIQKRAPAPAAEIASATPAIFPTPSVPASATARALYGDTPVSDFSFLRRLRIISPDFVTGKNLSFAYSIHPDAVRNATRAGDIRYSLIKNNILSPPFVKYPDAFSGVKKPAVKSHTDCSLRNLWRAVHRKKSCLHVK